MRSLVVGHDFPWPVVGGAQLRLQEVILALCDLGEVDLFTLLPARRRRPCTIPDGIAINRFRGAVTSPQPRSVRQRLAWARSRLPFEVAEASPCRAAPVFATWVEPPYDFVWFGKALTFELLGRPRLGPTVVDLDDLEDEKIRARMATIDRTVYPGRAAALRAGLARWQARYNARRWTRLQHSVADAVDAVALCSEEDLRRAALPNATVVPNVYETTGDQPVGARREGPPTLLFAGNFCYGPNADGARWFVSCVLPVLHRTHPDVQLRLVGEANSTVARLHDPPAVVVTGHVPGMEPELAAADVVVVPIRYGSGTRIKVLEAFAHRIPVVTTTLGAEGLHIEAGRHALLADDPEAFAAACAALLPPSRRADSLVDAAWALYRSRFQPDRARRAVAVMAQNLGGRDSPPAGGRDTPPSAGNADLSTEGSSP